jgi:hypothetical protein
MQQPNDDCECCAGFWKARGKAPIRLQRALDVTANRKMVVILCEHCDGDAYQISQQVK